MRHLLISGRAVVTTLALTTAAGIAACDTVKTGLLEAPNPTIIDPSSVQSPAGALSVRSGALARARCATGGGGSAWGVGGLLARERAPRPEWRQYGAHRHRLIQVNHVTRHPKLPHL